MTTTTDRQRFLAAIIADPEDDAPRLIYADWLDDHGEGEQAGFVRAQIHGESTEYWLAASQLDHSSRLGSAPDLRWVVYWQCSRTGAHPAPAWVKGLRLPFIQGVVYTFRRGFLDEMLCPAADWLVHADAIRAEHPVRRVRWTDWPSGEWGRRMIAKHNLDSPVTVADVCKLEWSGVEFELPPEPEVDLEGIRFTRRARQAMHERAMRG